MENVRVRHLMADGFYCFKMMLCPEARGTFGTTVRPSSWVVWCSCPMEPSDFSPQARNSLRVAQSVQLKKNKNKKQLEWKKTVPLASQEPFNWIGFELFLVRLLKQSYLHMIISRFLEFKVNLSKPPLIWGARESNFVTVMQMWEEQRTETIIFLPWEGSASLLFTSY